MRPTREGRVTPQRAGLVFKGIGFDPEAITSDPEPPTDRASLGEAYIPYLVTGAAELVQSKTGFSAGGSPNVTVTLDAPPTVGNVLVVFAAEDDDSGPAFTLTNGTWTQVGSTVYSGNGTNWPLRMYRQTVTGSTVQATQVYNAAGGTGTMKVVVAELSGVDTVDADIGSASNTATTTDTITPTASLPAVLVSGTFGRNGAPPQLAPAGSMTELAEIGVDRPLAVNYQEVASTTGSYTVGSTGASANSSMIAAAFEDTGDAVIWVIAPLTIDDDDATFHFVLEEGIDAASGVFWRGSLADSYLIGSTDIVVGIETAGANTITVQAGNEADYSDAVTIATIPFTATGTYTAQTVSDSWTPTAVYRYWQLVLTTTSNVNVYEVALFDVEDATGVSDHPSLTGRDDADQHPADAVSFTPAGTISATNVQDAIEEVAAEAGGGGGGTSILLTYNLAADISNQAITSGTFFDLFANQNFTVASATSIVEVSMRGYGFYNDNGTSHQYLCRINIDSGGTPVLRYMSGATDTHATLNSRQNALVGGNVFLSGLSAATHTIKAQITSLPTGANDHFYCRASTNGPTTGGEFLTVQVIEHLN